MSQVTVTGTAGPGLTVDAAVLTPIRSFKFTVGDSDPAMGDANILSVVMNDNTVKDFDITDATTCTITKVAGAYTVVVE